MKNYLVQEHYTEYLRGTRIVQVQEANTITDTNHLMNGWKELAVECNDAGVPLAQVKQWEEE